MSEQLPQESRARVREKIKEYPKLTKSNALLFPYLNEIRALRARDAAYDDIRLILAEEKVIVSLNTLYRFCRDVLGEKTSAPPDQRPRAKPPAPVLPASKVEPTLPAPTLQTAFQDRRERLPGVWGKRRRGPRIADSKNL